MIALRFAVPAFLAAAGIYAQDCAKLLPGLEQAVVREPRNPEAQANLGVNRFRCGMALAALDPLRQSIELAPASSAGYFYLGVSLLALDREEEAKGAFRRMAALNAGDAEQLYLVQKGYTKLSTALLERLAQSSPESARLNLVRAELFDLENRPDQALQEYRNAAAKEPKQAAFRYALGSAYWARFQAVEALPEFAAAVDLDSAHYMAHYKMGLALIELDRVTEAVRYLEKAVQIQPGFANGHFALAKALSKLGLSERALSAVDAGLTIDSQNQSGQYLKAQILRKLGRSVEADEQFHRLGSRISN